MSSSKLIELSPTPSETLTNTILLAQHRLEETGLFTDESLIRMIDEYPGEFCNVNRMGDNAKECEWTEGDTNGLCGAELLRAVKNGRLWLTLRQLTNYQPELGRVIDQLYDELEELAPGFVAFKRKGNLLISSPTAQVYLHVDVPQNMLWHIRGKKRVWVYPPDDPRMIDPNQLESILAVKAIEDIPYREEFDDFAEVHDLSPGQFISWPQNSPHRVVNLEGLNVSLSTEHYTTAAYRRVRVHRANRMLREKLGVDSLSTQTNGLGYALKSTAYAGYQVAERLGLTEDQQYEIPVTFRVDPDAPGGYVEFDKE